MNPSFGSSTIDSSSGKLGSGLAVLLGVSVVISGSSSKLPRDGVLSVGSTPMNQGQFTQ